MHEITTNEKKVMNLKESGEGYMGEFGGKGKNVVNIHIFYKIAKI